MYYISCGNIISYGPCNMIKRGCPINILIENQYNLRPMSQFTSPAWMLSWKSSLDSVTQTIHWV